MAKRIFLIVLDSFGIGAARDANLFGDEGADTLGRIALSSEFYIPNLIKLGLGNIDGVSSVDAAQKPLASYQLTRGLISIYVILITFISTY